MYCRRLLVALGFLGSFSLFASDWEEKMYEHLNADIATFKQDLKPYLLSLYSNALDRHNLSRLYDYLAIYKNLETDLFRIEPESQLILAGLEKRFKDLDNDQLPTSRRAEILSEVPKFRTELSEIQNKLAFLASSSKRLLAAWSDRKSQKVLDYLNQQFDFKSLFHEPIIAPSAGYDSYVFYVSASYIPSSNTVGYSSLGIETKLAPVNVAFKVAEGTTTALLITGKVLSRATAGAILGALLVVDLFYNGHKLGVHEQKIKTLIEEEYQVINKIRDEISTDQSQFMKSSIDNILSDNLAGGSSFSSKLEQLNADIEVFAHRLASKITPLKEKFATNYALFEKDLERLATANTREIVDGLMKQRDEDRVVMRNFDAEASAFIFKNGRSILESIQHRGALTTSSIAQAYDALEKVMRADGRFAEKYLRAPLFRSKFDFFTNDRTFYASTYPIGDWLAFLSQFSEKAKLQ